MNDQYSSLASCYDRLNSSVNYEEWADFIEARLTEHGIKKGSLVLDLACGTGNITLPLAKRGFDMIGVDISPEMLQEGMNKACNGNILWLCQDMRSFELYGTVAATVCCLDSINYLTAKTGLMKCISLVHNYLDPNGIFIFDVNSLYKFKHVYGSNSYILESEGVYCGWENSFDEKSGKCEFYLSIFSENEDGSYTRLDELQRERYWSRATLRSVLERSGFEILSEVSDFDMSPVCDDSERIFYICKAIK